MKACLDIPGCSASVAVKRTLYRPVNWRKLAATDDAATLTHCTNEQQTDEMWREDEKGLKGDLECIGKTL